MKFDRIAEAAIVQIAGYRLHLGFTEFLEPSQIIRNALIAMAPRYRGHETPLGRGPAAVHWLGFCIRIHEPKCECRFCKNPNSTECNWRRQCLDHAQCARTGVCQRGTTSTTKENDHGQA